MCLRNIILELHRIFYGANEKHKYKNHNVFLWLVCNVMSRICDRALAVYLWVYKTLNLYPQPLKGDDSIVVSLTTFPKRISKVWMVADSLFHQKVPPSHIYLYLSEEEFPEGRNQLPNRLLRYESLGLEIVFRKDNLMPHNKYFYALQEHKDKNVITVDDDIYYHDDLVQNLVNLHRQFPTCVCANRTHKIGIGVQGDFLPYKKWNQNFVPCQPAHFYLALGYAGVLYPAHLFESTNEIFNIDKIKGISLKADDLWLKVHELISNKKVVTGRYYCVGPIIIGSQRISLMSNNCEGENDSQWHNLCSTYNISDKMLFSM